MARSKQKSKAAKKTTTTTTTFIKKPYGGKTLIIEKELRKYCRKQGDLTYGELLANGDDWGGASILLAIPALRTKYNYDRDDISNSLRTLRRHHSNGHSMLDKPAAKKSNAKTSKSKKKSVSTPKNNTSKYIGERVSVQVDDWGEKPFYGNVEYESDADELVVAYDDGTYEYFSSEASMSASGVKIVPRYDAVRLAQSFVKKGSIRTGSTTQFNWRGFGLQVGLCFNALPDHCSFLYGPLDAEGVSQSQTKTKKKRKRAVEEEAPAASTSKSTATTTRTSKRGKSGSDNNKKVGDDVPPTSPASSTKEDGDKNDELDVADKENGALDTNVKGGEKENGALDTNGKEGDKDMQSSEGNGSMQSPAKSTEGGDVLQTVTTGLANDIGKLAVGALNEAMEKDEADNVAPLQNEIASTKDQITSSNLAMERIASLLASKDSLPSNFKLPIDTSNSDKDKEDNTQLVKALENKVLEMESQLERIVGNTPARKQLYISIIQKELELQAADNVTVPLLTEGSDNNAITITNETGDNDETNGVAQWLTTKCQGMVQGIIQGVLKQLNSIKSKELETAFQSQYEATVTPHRKKEERDVLVHKHNVAANALELIDEGAESFPGSEEDYWNEFQDEYDRLKKKETGYANEYYKMESDYNAVKEKFVEGMNRYDEHLQKAFTIKIGGAEIKPTLEQLRVDDEGGIVRVDDGSGSGEEEEDEEEDGENMETQDAVYRGRRGQN